eukprot:SAG22_NODE_14620_length_369_cov_8.181481_1_plen_62_part_10
MQSTETKYGKGYDILYWYSVFGLIKSMFPRKNAWSKAFFHEYTDYTDYLHVNVQLCKVPGPG